MTDRQSISFSLNGVDVSGEAEVRTNLADFLRRGLGKTGTHIGCEHGVCGACTVLVDGKAIRSCLMLAVQAEGSQVTTVEGLADKDGQMNVLQEQMKKHHGLQCGYCTPGVLITLTDLLQKNPRPTRDEVRVALTGNLCRCTGYKGIVDAAMAASDKMAAGGA